jgi:hypothetical protein
MKKRASQAPPQVIFDKTYYGFEDFFDYSRDVGEAVDPTYNPRANVINGEWQGKVRVRVTYVKG